MMQIALLILFEQPVIFIFIDLFFGSNDNSGSPDLRSSSLHPEDMTNPSPQD